MPPYETHIFTCNHIDRYGRKSERQYAENINVTVTHLVLIPHDVEGDESPIFAIRQFSLLDAIDCATAHGLTDYAIWERLENRSFAPMVKEVN